VPARVNACHLRVLQAALLHDILIADAGPHGKLFPVIHHIKIANLKTKRAHLFICALVVYAMPTNAHVHACTVVIAWLCPHDASLSA